MHNNQRDIGKLFHQHRNKLSDLPNLGHFATFQFSNSDFQNFLRSLYKRVLEAAPDISGQDTEESTGCGVEEFNVPLDLHDG